MEEETTFSMESLYEKAKDYTDTTLELARLKALDKAAGAVGALVPRLVLLLVMVLFVFSANIALALWLGSLTGQAYYGFLIVSGLYLLLGLLIRYAWQESLSKKISDAIISNLLS